MLKNTSVIYFHKLLWKPDPDKKDSYLIIRNDTDDTIIVGSFESTIARDLYNGMSIQEVAEKNNVEIHSVKDIVITMLDSGFLTKFDNVLVPEFSEKIHPWLKNIPASAFKWILNKYLFLTTFIIILSGWAFGFMIPGFMPSVEDFLWMDDIAVVYVINLFIQYALVFTHEFAHFATTKAIGCQAKISISYRFIYLVFQTENYRLYTKSKKLRYIVYLSGIYSDLFLIGAAYWFLFLAQYQGVNLGIYFNLIKAQILLLFASICWQMNAYLQTDVYNFISDYMDEPNLYNNTKKFILNKIKSVRTPFNHLIKPVSDYFFDTETIHRETDDFRSFTDRQKTRMVWYAGIVAFGLFATSIFFFFFIFYREVLYVLEGVNLFIISIEQKKVIDATKALLLIAAILFQYVLLILLIAKKKPLVYKK